MQLYAGREGAKIREDLLKCKCVPPASVICYRVYICTHCGGQRV